MKKNISLIFMIFAMLFLFIFNIKDVKADVYDEISLLTPEELQQISSEVDTYEKEHKYNVIVRFYNGSSYSIDTETQNWYDNNYSNLEYKSSVVFMIDMLNRSTLIQAYDKLSYVDFTDDSYIVNKTSDYLAAANYKACITYFLKELNAEVRSQKTTTSAFIIIANLLIFNIGCFVIASNFGRKKTTIPENYIASNAQVNQNNIFLRKTVTKTKKSSSSSSSGGHSHGGGGHGHF